jgi:phage FluMu gp28-like protein
VIDAPGDLGLLRPKQREWVADPADVKIAEKGRRTGFTFGEASDDVLIAASDRSAGGQPVYYIGTTLDMAREYIDACGRWAVGYQYAASEIDETVLEDIDEHGNSKSIKALRIDFPSGFFILALSSRPRSLRGRQGVVVIDEAAFQDDLPGLIKAAIALIILGGKVRIISTHNGVENYFNELVTECRAQRLSYSLHRCTFDDAIQEGLYKTRCQAKGEPWTAEGERKFIEGVRGFYRGNEAEELDCIPANSGGTYLPLALQLPCENDAVKVVRFDFEDDFLAQPLSVRDADVEGRCRDQLQPLIDAMDPEAPSYFGGDFGRSANRTTFWPAQLMRTNFLKSAFVLELYNCPFAQHRTIFKWIVDRLPRFTAGKLDARGNGAELAEFMRTEYGVERVEEVKATLDWYRINWPFAKARLEDRATDIPKDRDVQEDLRAVKVIKGVPVIPEQSQGSDKSKKKRHGDAAIAFLNLTAAARAEPFAVGYEAPSKKPRDRYEPSSGDERFAMRAAADDDFSAARQRATL